MKTNNLIAIIVMITKLGYSQSSIPVMNAINNGIVDYHVSGSWNSDSKIELLDGDGQYFGKCMIMKLKSKIDTVILLDFKDGIMLISEDSTVQNMVLTKEMHLALNPHEEKNLEFYAMCTEINDGVPSKLTSYRLQNVMNNNLAKIASAIDNLCMNNIAGQGAIWAFTDKAMVEDLNNYGATESTIRLTREILNEAQVNTLLNPLQEKIIPTVANEESSNDYILMNKYFVYTSFGILLLLSISGFYLLHIALRRKDDKSVPA